MVNRFRKHDERGEIEFLGAIIGITLFIVLVTVVLPILLDHQQGIMERLDKEEEQKTSIIKETPAKDKGKELW